MATIDKYLKVRKGIDAPDVLTSSATIYDYLKTPVVYFDTTASATPTIGGMVWDDGEGTLSFGLKGGNVNLQIGQENIALCYNGTASTISNGAVVYISSVQGQKPSISLASAISEEGSSKVFGVTSEDIPSGGEGFVATFGIVGGINTIGFTEGDALWLSASPGKFTKTKPLSPTHLVFIGYCLKVNSNSGRIFVNPQNGYELEELHDVLITGASQNHIIYYNSASNLWMNKNILDAVKEIDGSNSGIDSDLLDGQQGSYYLDWTNTTNKPDPILTLAGDLSGSAIFTDLNNATLNAQISSLFTKKFVQNIGDDVSTSFSIVHNLGTRDVQVQIYDNSTYETIECDITRNSINEITIDFFVVAASSQYRAVIIG